MGYPSTGEKIDRDIETIIQDQEEQTQKPSVLFSAPRVHLTPVAFEFYVDGEYGDDYNDGHSPTTALKTVNHPQSSTLQIVTYQIRRYKLRRAQSSRACQGQRSPRRCMFILAAISHKSRRFNFLANTRAREKAAGSSTLHLPKAPQRREFTEE